MQKKSHLKNLLAVFLAAMMILSAVPLSLAGAEDPLVYELSTDGEYYSVVGCDKNAGEEIIVPATHKGKPVKNIGSKAINGCDNVTSVVILYGIEKIDSFAVSDCNNLKSVYIPKSVTEIAETAVGYESNLEKLNNGDLIVFCKEDSVAATYANDRLLEKNADCPHKITDKKEENKIDETCGKEGSYDLVTYCTVCGDVLGSESKSIPAIGHKNKVHHEKVEPTCTKKGTIEYWECPDCSKNFSDENCTVEAETLEIAEAAHSEEILPAVPATCTKTGLTEGKKCSVCGEVILEQNTIPAIGHKNKVHHEKVEPTCKEGYTGNTYCLGCGKLIATGSNVKNPENHDGGTEIRDVKAATCTEEGYTGNTYCLGCGKLIATGSSSEKTEHNFGEWEVVTEATCTEEGLEKRVCKNDETHVEERTITATGHTPETVGAKDATCTEDGYTGDSVCKTCNAILETGKVIAAKGHVDEDGDSVCDVCKEKLSSETPETPCDCACHQKGFKKLWFKICLFFQMIFDKNRVCKCGVWHY